MNKTDEHNHYHFRNIVFNVGILRKELKGEKVESGGIKKSSIGMDYYYYY